MTGKPLPMAQIIPPALREKPKRERLPEWFRTSLPNGKQQAIFNETKAAVSDKKRVARIFMIVGLAVMLHS